MTERDCQFQDLFNAHGLRCTRQRTALYKLLCDSKNHPTADDLHKSLTDAGMSLATVYNTLEAFCKAGLAQKLPSATANGSARYDATRDNHLHLRCRETGNIADVPEHLGKKILACIPPESLAELEADLGFKVDRVEIQLVGQKA